MEDLEGNMEKANCKNETAPENPIPENNRFQNNPMGNVPAPGQFYPPAGPNQGPLMPRNNFPPQNMNRSYPQNPQFGYGFQNNFQPGNSSIPGMTRQPMPMPVADAKKSNTKYLWLLIPCILLFISNIVILTIYLKSESRDYKKAYTDLASTVAVQSFKDALPGMASDIINESFGGSSSSNGQTVSTNQISTPQADSEPQDNYTPLLLGETIDLDFMELTLAKVDWTRDIMPPHYDQCDSSVYTHVTSDTDEIMLVLYGTVKNKFGEDIDLDDIETQFVFNDKFTYTGYFKDEDNDNCGFGYGYIKPLRGTDIVLYVKVPDEVKNIFEKCDLFIGFDENLEHHYRTDISEKDYRYHMEIQ